jgi:acylphosphatase
VLVEGRVQGVFFRDSCRSEATAAHLHGWVRNLPDGRVEAVFEGDADAVQRLVDWCRIGPPRASVARIEVHVEEPVGERGFRIG